MKFSIKKSNINYGILWIVFLLYFLSIEQTYIESYFYICLEYIILNILVSFLLDDYIHMLPISVIRITGFVRYFLIPYSLNMENMSLYLSHKIVLIMCIEMFAEYFAIYLFYILNRKHIIRAPKFESKSFADTIIELKHGSGVVLILIIGLFLSIMYPNIITNIFTIKNKSSYNFDFGLIDLIISSFYLILYLHFFKSICTNELFSRNKKIILLIVISILFICCNTFTTNNVSRWSLLLLSYICYFFIIRIFPEKKKLLLSFLLIVVTFSLLAGTAIKFKDHKGRDFSSLKSTANEVLSYKSLDSYFSGPKNMLYGIELAEELPNSFAYRMKMISSDFFANSPFLNKFLSDSSYSSNLLFNVKVNRTIYSIDQIIPSSIQLYIYVGDLFPILSFTILYLSLYFFQKVRYETDSLKIYMCIYVSFFLSLMNCISMSVIFQTFWIHILPIYIIYRLNHFKIKVNNS